jgi:hypothetical protein
LSLSFAGNRRDRRFYGMWRALRGKLLLATVFHVLQHFDLQRFDL